MLSVPCLGVDTTSILSKPRMRTGFCQLWRQKTKHTRADRFSMPTRRVCADHRVQPCARLSSGASHRSVRAYRELLLDALDGGLQGPGAPRGLVLHRLHRLQQGRHVGHHHLSPRQPGHDHTTTTTTRGKWVRSTWTARHFRGIRTDRLLDANL